MASSLPGSCNACAGKEPGIRTSVLIHRAVWARIDRTRGCPMTDPVVRRIAFATVLLGCTLLFVTGATSKQRPAASADTDCAEEKIAHELASVRLDRAL